MGVAWSEMMSVGVPALDTDHKTLVGLINSLHRSIGDDEEYATLGTVLQALSEYAESHFAREERVMEVCDYPSLAAHVHMHRRLAAKVRELQERYDADRTTVRARDCLDFLHSWLIDHICSSDMDYRAWVVGHEKAFDAADSLDIAPRGKGQAVLDWKRLRVLVVDDNLNFCEVIRTILEGVGVAGIRTVNSIETAKAALETTALDLLISDWHVGQDSGLELVHWVRARPELADLPVLMLSGHERLSNREVAISAGADDFLEKPVTVRGLLLCIARLTQRAG